MHRPGLPPLPPVRTHAFRCGGDGIGEAAEPGSSSSSSSSSSAETDTVRKNGVASRLAAIVADGGADWGGATVKVEAAVVKEEMVNAPKSVIGYPKMGSTGGVGVGRCEPELYSSCRGHCLAWRWHNPARACPRLSTWAVEYDVG